MRISKRDRVYAAVLAGAVLVAVLAEVLTPAPLDWRETYEHADARPFGSAVLYRLLPGLFPGAPIEPVDAPPYLAMRNAKRAGTTYFFVTSRFAPDEVEADRLLGFAARGNTVFAAAHAIEGPLAEALHLETERPFGFDSLQVGFVSPSLGAEAYTYRSLGGAAHFALGDASEAVVLGTDAEGRAVYVRVRHGEGALYLHTVPQAFTNYYLLNGHHAEYAYKALAHLPVQPLWWDAHYKPLRQAATTPFRFILSEPALRSAWYVLLACAVLFVLFEAKRRQRAIPVQAPPRNDTLAFTETVGRLYHQRGDHAHLARKRIAHFFDYLRAHLRFTPDALDERAARRVAERSGVSAEDVRALFAEIEEARRRDPLPEDGLHALSARLEDFYAASRR